MIITLQAFILSSTLSSALFVSSSVSPFEYHATPSHPSPDFGPSSRADSISGGGSTWGGGGSGITGSYNDHPVPRSPFSTGGGSSSDVYAGDLGTVNSSSSGNTALLGGAAAVAALSGTSSQRGGGDRRRSSLTSSTGGGASTSVSGGSYRLRTRNVTDQSQFTNSGVRPEAPPLPRKGLLNHGDEFGTMNDGSNPNRRVVQHADAGPLVGNNENEEDLIDELPPQYGGWQQQQQQQLQQQQQQQQQQNVRQASELDSFSSSPPVENPSASQQNPIEVREDDASMFYHSERPQFNHRF